MKLAERRAAKAEGRPVRTLQESDFLLGVKDLGRQGALRFREAGQAEFQAAGGACAIPPFMSLGKLMAASEKVFDDDPDGEFLKYLLRPGASVGGARPKALVVRPGGNLIVAKFPGLASPGSRDVPAWENVALNLSERAGIRTASHEMRGVAGRNVLLLDRFDRRGATGFRICPR